MRICYGLFVAAVLSGCVGFVPGEPGVVGPLSFLNTYEASLNDYKKGRIMAARKRILAMDKTREDYPQALKLLKQKVEPARSRLLKHYNAKAKAAERKGKWSEAMTLYVRASELSTQPKRFKKKSYNMELKMRQDRMDNLITQKRIEDSQLLIWLNAYEPPKGVAAKDQVFERSREHVQDVIEDRGSFAYREARRYLSDGLPEIAYVEVESYLRLIPDSERGKRLLSDIKAEMPKGIQIASVKSRATKPTLSKRVRMPDTVKRKQVLELIRKADWIKAKKFALAYRRAGGGKDAERLLKKIKANTEKAAAIAFSKGRLAFRKENLDEAVRFWEKAALLMPKHIEYVSALQRALQLQEQLRILRTETEAEAETEKNKK